MFKKSTKNKPKRRKKYLIFQDIKGTDCLSCFAGIISLKKWEK